MFLRIWFDLAADWVAFQIEATPNGDHASNLGFNKPPSRSALGYAKIDNRIGVFRLF
jgi:phage tail sheath protein FI